MLKNDDQGDIKMTEEKHSDKIMVQPLPEILRELQASINDAKDAAKEARQAADEAKLASKDVPRELIRKMLTSPEFLIMMVVIIVATVIGAVAISVGVSAFGK
jgi:hypothetical protein